MARLLLAPLPCRRNPGRTAFVSRTTQPFGLNRRMTARISGRAGQNNPHRGGEIRSENRFASKHVLATLKSRTTAEARIWVREIIVGQMGLWNLDMNFLRRVTLGTCRTHRSSVVSSPFLLFSRSKSFATSTATSRSSSPPNPASTSSLGPRNIPYGNPPYASM